MFLFLWSFFSSSIPFLDIKQILGITIALIASIIFFYDSLLMKIFHSKNNISHIDLASAIKVAKEYSNNITQIRIYALTTNMIQPIFKAVEIKATECKILLHQPKNIIKNPSEILKSYLENIKMLVREWNALQNNGSIEKVEIKKYSFLPTEYLIIVDEKVVIHGHYLLDDKHFPLCDVQEPILVYNNNSDNRLLIEKRILFFDKLFNNIK